MSDLYRDTAVIGNGGTADAVRANVGHIQKAGDYIIALTKWINAHPNADPDDIKAAESMLTDLISALAGKPFPGGK